jgi:hypothetical protein
VIVPSGLTGSIPASQTDIGSDNLGNSTVAVNITKLWVIPANDANSGTEYIIEAPFNGVWGTPGQTLDIGIMHNGVFANICPTGGIAAADNVTGDVRLHLKCTSSGSGGNTQVWTEGVMADSSVNRVPGSVTTLVGLLATHVFNTTTANTVSIGAKWSATSSGQTLTGQTSSFYRLGP